MRYFILLVPLLALLTLACNGGGEAQPTATAELEATATPMLEASPTREPTTGTIVFLRGTDLWIASPDGESMPPRAITSGSLFTRYAGFVRGPDGETDLYFVRQLSEERVENNRRPADYGLYRAPMDEGTPEELLRFSHPFLGSVSPDGEHFMYSEMRSLWLLDLASGESSRLLEGGACVLDSGGDCDDYGGPQWSPDGEVVMVREGLYEKVLNILLNPFESPIDVTEAGHGYGRPAWSPDGERLCSWGRGVFDAANLDVHSIATGETTDILAQLPIPTLGKSPKFYVDPDLFGCAWSPDGRLAVGYSEDLVGPGRIAILDSAFSIIVESDTIEDLSTIVAWLPDGSGVLFNRVPLSYEPLEPRPPGLFDLQRGIVDLPFEADLVLGVIP